MGIKLSFTLPDEFLQKTQNLVIPRCSFVVEGSEMYKDLERNVQSH